MAGLTDGGTVAIVDGIDSLGTNKPGALEPGDYVAVEVNFSIEKDSIFFPSSILLIYNLFSNLSVKTLLQVHSATSQTVKGRYLSKTTLREFFSNSIGERRGKETSNVCT